MAYYALILISCLLLTSGCAHRLVKETAERKVLMPDLEINQLDQFKEQKVFGYVKPYVPVIEPPVVKKVWIPDHKSDQDSGVLVAGHWVYLMIRGPKWFIEDEIQDSILPIIVPGKEGKGEKNEEKYQSK